MPDSFDAGPAEALTPGTMRLVADAPRPFILARIRDGSFHAVSPRCRWPETVSHVEVHGPDFKGSLAGGHKTLFRLDASGAAFGRLAAWEASIDKARWARMLFLLHRRLPSLRKKRP